MEAEVILDPSWNNPSPYKGISVTLGDGGEQLGSVKIRTILCSLKKGVVLSIVIFFLKNRCAVS